MSRHRPVFDQTITVVKDTRFQARMDCLPKLNVVGLARIPSETAIGNSVESHYELPPATKVWEAVALIRTTLQLIFLIANAEHRANLPS